MEAHHETAEAAEFQGQLLARNIFSITMIGAVVFCGCSFYVLFG